MNREEMEDLIETIPANRMGTARYKQHVFFGARGYGNIGGVASAVALGNPGAIFWMWITAMVGMMTKMVEVTLAVYYRDAESDGRYVGGPLFYIEKGIRPKCKL